MSPARPASPSCSSWSSNRAESRCCARATSCASRSSTSAAWSATGGERGLLSIAFPPDYAAQRRFYVYYTDNAGNIRVDEFQRRDGDTGGARLRRAVIDDPPPGQRQPQRRPAPVPRQPPLLRHRGRRLRRRPAQQRPEQGEPARQAAAHRPARQRRSAVLGARRQPLRRQAGARRDLQLRPAQPLPLLLRHDHRGQPRIAIGDVGQNRFEELDYTTVGGAERRQLRLGRVRGLRPLQEENSGTPDPGGTTKPIFAYSHSRGGSCSIIGGYVVAGRHRAPTRPLRLRRLLPGPAAQPMPTCTGRRRPQARPRRSLPTSFGEDSAGPHLHRLAGRSGLPHCR